jgi:hypothetical protein
MEAKIIDFRGYRVACIASGLKSPVTSYVISEHRRSEPQAVKNLVSYSVNLQYTEDLSAC